MKTGDQLETGYKYSAAEMIGDALEDHVRLLCLTYGLIAV